MFFERSGSWEATKKAPLKQSFRSFWQVSTACLQRCDGVVPDVEEAMFPDLSADERARLHAQLRGAVRALSLQGI